MLGFGPQHLFARTPRAQVHDVPEVISAETNFEEHRTCRTIVEAVAQGVQGFGSKSVEVLGLGLQV